MSILGCQKASRIVKIYNINFYTWVRPPPTFIQCVKKTSDLVADGFPCKLWSWTSSNKKCWPRASKGSGWMKPQVGQNPNSSITFAAFSAITLENPMVSLDFQEWGLRLNNLHKLRELRALCWVEWAVWGAFNCPDAVVAIRSVWLSEYAKSFCCATFYTVESNHMMLSMRLEEMHKGWWLPPD